MEVEGTEQNIILQPEGMIVGAVTSVNGQTGDVVLTTSDLENTSDYQTGQDVQDAIAGKQDKLTAGNNIQISEQNVISATNTTYSAGNGINISGENAISVDTTVVATQQNLSDEVTNRENADIYLQGQIDAISASSDVVDIVGTYADLQNYDTSKLKDNDIIKVLQDETQGNATTYYRWSTHTETFTLIGQEGPYYTKAGADAQFVPQTRTVNGKALSANITLNASDVSALGTSDVAQTTGSSTSMVMSQKATTDALDTKLNITDYVVDTQLADSDNPVQNRVLNGLLGDMPSDFFSGSATTSPTASTSVQFGDILNLDDVQLLGDTTQETTTGKNLFDKSNYIGAYRATYTEISNGLKATATATGGAAYVSISIPNSDGLLGRTARLSIGDKVSHDGSNLNVVVYQSSGGSTVSGSPILTLPGTTKEGTCTFPSSYSGSNNQFVIIFYCQGDTVGAYSEYTDIQLELGSSTTSYEKYTGGIPAPNPDYPETINVVTGVQTVTVSDGGSNTQIFTIDLGATELCKIGTYQDKIYKSGGDWYVHKETGMLNLSAMSNNFADTAVSNGYSINRSYLTDFSLPVGSTNYLITTFTPVSNASTSTFTIGKSFMGNNWLNLNYNNSASDLAGFKAWISTSDTKLYAPLPTPTDTKITDATLISELEAVLNASTYDGETDIEITATGTNLPAPLQITAVNANAKGIVYKLRA